jgi:hypothetical protein
LKSNINFGIFKLKLTKLFEVGDVGTKI